MGTDGMKKTVREGYEKGDYGGRFRKERHLKSFETDFFESLESHLIHGSSILDLGCGTGIPYDRHLTDRGFRITGMDFSEKHISEARRNVHEAVYIPDDYSREGSIAGAFDAVISLYSVFHIPREERSGIFRRIREHLNPGGMMLVTLGTAGYEYSEEEDWAGAPVMAWSSWSPEEYAEMISEAGFKIMRSDYE